MSILNILKSKVVFLIVILPLLLIFNPVFALDTLVADEIQVGVAAISEVKASKIVTISKVPKDKESIDIGNCKIVFSSDVSDNNETDCIDDNAKVYTGSKSISELSDILDTLTNITDTNHGILTVETNTQTTTKFTTTETEKSATNIKFNGVDGITATEIITGVIPILAEAQIIEFTPTAASAANVRYRANINGSNYDYISVSTDTVQTIVEGLQLVIDANPDVTCTEDNTKITCTQDIPGTSFIYASFCTPDITSPVFSTFTISGGTEGYAKAGDKIKISLNINPADT
jgi:hypothetical protein